jgi:dTDP-4-dehydrorhamnose reductase
MTTPLDIPAITLDLDLTDAACVLDTIARSHPDLVADAIAFHMHIQACIARDTAS